jgi:hypothetical protein
VPCCVLEESEGHAHKTEQKETEHKCTEENDDCCKDCSPFYVCGTCIGFTFPIFAAFAFVVPFKALQHDTVYVPVELPMVTTPIWQPPKLS